MSLKNVLSMSLKETHEINMAKFSIFDGQYKKTFGPCH